MVKGSPVRITADGVIGISGAPTIVYSVVIESGGTAAVIRLLNGTDSNGTEYLDVTGTANRTLPVPDIAAGGLFFPGGVFADIDANTTSLICWVEHIRNA